MLENRRPLKILIVSLLLLGASFFGIWEIQFKNLQKNQTPLRPSGYEGQVIQVKTPTKTVSPAELKIFYPIQNYLSRLKVRDFGKVVKPGDEKSLVCGRSFDGLHNGDDLEISATETDLIIRVFSIADGDVVQISNVDGYGGLLVAKYKLNNEDLTAYYGHLKLASISTKAGDKLFAGRQIGILGKGCSSETSGERKHLHFAIHKGNAVDIRGYVQSEQDLNFWLDPMPFLQTNRAAEPAG